MKVGIIIFVIFSTVVYTRGLKCLKCETITRLGKKPGLCHPNSNVICEDDNICQLTRGTLKDGTEYLLRKCVEDEDLPRGICNEGKRNVRVELDEKILDEEINVLNCYCNATDLCNVNEKVAKRINGNNDADDLAKISKMAVLLAAIIFMYFI